MVACIVLIANEYVVWQTKTQVVANVVFYNIIANLLIQCLCLQLWPYSIWRTGKVLSLEHSISFTGLQNVSVRGPSSAVILNKLNTLSVHHCHTAMNLYENSIWIIHIFLQPYKSYGVCPSCSPPRHLCGTAMRSGWMKRDSCTYIYQAYYWEHLNVWDMSTYML